MTWNLFLKQVSYAKFLSGVVSSFCLWEIFVLFVLLLDKITTKYENIFKENVENMKIVLKRLKQNMEKREKIQNQKQEFHETFTGPLFPVQCSIVIGIG